MLKNIAFLGAQVKCIEYEFVFENKTLLSLKIRKKNGS